MVTKQIIVIRKDLKMRKGKMIAQGSHASMAVFFNLMTDFDDSGTYTMKLPVNNMIPMKDWIDESFTKVVVSVDSENELLELYGKAKDAKLPCSIIKDEGRTEFNGVETFTAIAIGPELAENIDPITNHLPLL